MLNLNSVIDEVDKIRQKEELIIRQKKNHEDEVLMCAQNTQSFHIKYGVLWYNLFTMQGVALNHYKILHTSSNMEEMNMYIEQQLIHYLRKKIKCNLLLYQVSVDPNVVSYDFITKSTNPYVNIQISKHEILCTLTGNINLTEQLNLPILIKYNDYYNQIVKLKKKQLVANYVAIFESNPIKTKQSIIKKLLNNKKLTLLLH